MGLRPGLLQPVQDHQVTFIVDGGPDLILGLVDGILCDGGELADARLGPVLRRLMGFGGEGKLRMAAAKGRVKDLASMTARSACRRVLPSGRK